MFVVFPGQAHQGVIHLNILNQVASRQSVPAWGHVWFLTHINPDTKKPFQHTVFRLECSSLAYTRDQTNWDSLKTRNYNDAVYVEKSWHNQKKSDNSAQQNKADTKIEWYKHIIHVYVYRYHHAFWHKRSESPIWSSLMQCSTAHCQTVFSWHFTRKQENAV